MRRFYVTLYTDEYVRPYKVILADDLDKAIEATRLEMPKVRDFLDANRLDPAGSGLFIMSSSGTAPCVLKFVEALSDEDVQISITFGTVQRTGRLGSLRRS